MKDVERRKVLDALNLYPYFKQIINKVPEMGAVIVIYECKGRTVSYSRVEIEKSIKVVEDTCQYFETEDDCKVHFIQKLFFEKNSWVAIEFAVGISHSTIQNWRNEVIKIAAKIARRAELI